MSDREIRNLVIDKSLEDILPKAITNLITSYDHIFENIIETHNIFNSTIKHIVILGNGDMVTISGRGEIIIWRDDNILASHIKSGPYNISCAIPLEEDSYVLSNFNYKDYISEINVYKEGEIKYSTNYDGNVLKLLSLSENKILIGHSFGINGVENILRIWDYTSKEEKNCKRIGHDSLKISLRRNNVVCLQGNNLLVATLSNSIFIFDLNGDLETPYCVRYLEFSPSCLAVIGDQIIHSYYNKPYVCWYNTYIDSVINNKVKTIKILKDNKCAIVVTDSYDKDIIQIWNYIKKYMIFAFPQIDKENGESITLGGLTLDDKLFFTTSKNDLVISNLNTWKHEYIKNIDNLNYYLAPTLDNKGRIIISISKGDISIIK
jgi:hypothetical protein